MLGLATEVFRMKSGLDAKVAVYRGGGPALTDVIAGHVQAMFGTPVVKQNIDKGDVRALAVSGRKRLDLLPQVPTFSEAGLPMPEVDAGAWFGLLAPAGTPADTVAWLNREFNAALGDPELRAALKRMGLEPHGTTPQAFASFIREEIVRSSAPRGSCRSSRIERCGLRGGRANVAAVVGRSEVIEILQGDLRHDRERPCAAPVGNHGCRRVHGISGDAAEGRAMASDRGLRRDDVAADLGAPAHRIESVRAAQPILCGAGLRSLCLS
jgi:hypothetical protein